MANRQDPLTSGIPPATNERAQRLHLLLAPRDRIVALIFLSITAGLVPWTVFLGLSLPPKYSAGHWNLLWTGFDTGLVCVLGYAAWAAWFRRQIVATTAIVAGTLLICDAWFDTITSIGHSDHWVSLLTALGGELPLAVFFFWLYRRIVLKSLAFYHELVSDGPPPRKLRQAQILFLSTNRPRPKGESGQDPLKHPTGTIPTVSTTSVVQDSHMGDSELSAPDHQRR